MPTYAETATTAYAIYQAVKWAIIVWFSLAIAVWIYEKIKDIWKHIK